MLTSRAVVLAKIETTYNVDPTPVAGTDAVLVQNVSWSHEGARMNERPATRPGLGKLQHVFGGTLKAVEFECELKGAGAAYSASVRPEVDVLLRACGFGTTVVTTPGSESVTYKPVSTGHESITIYYFEDGKRAVITGCRGNVEFSMETGGIGKAKFRFVGHEATPTDVALPTPTFDSTVPPAIKGGAFTIGGYSAIISALNFNPNNALAMPPNFSAADGYAEIRITGRDVSGSFDPEDVLVATKNFINEWKNGTTGALATGTIAGAQYNRYSVSMPVVYYREVAPGDRDGIRTLDLTFGAAESTGDDEVSLLFN